MLIFLFATEFQSLSHLQSFDILRSSPRCGRGCASDVVAVQSVGVSCMITQGVGLTGACQHRKDDKLETSVKTLKGWSRVGDERALHAGRIKGLRHCETCMRRLSGVTVPQQGELARGCGKVSRGAAFVESVCELYTAGCRQDRKWSPNDKHWVEDTPPGCRIPYVMQEGCSVGNGAMCCKGALLFWGTLAA